MYINIYFSKSYEIPSNDSIFEEESYGINIIRKQEKIQRRMLAAYLSSTNNFERII
jgi:hypothetical protein